MKQTEDPQKDIQPQQDNTHTVLPDPESDHHTYQVKGSSTQFVCWTYLKEYATTFAQNFERSFREANSGSTANEPLPISGIELHRILFLSIDEKNNLKDIRETFKKLVRCTGETEYILSRTWLLMVKDIIDCLLDRGGRLSSLDPFLQRIHEQSELLSDVYFEMSQAVLIKKPDFDLSTSSYQEIMSNFGRYLNREADEEDSPELKIHTYYNSIPIELNATVRQVNSASVTFNVHPYEAVSLSVLGMAFIKSSLHDAVFKAYASNVDIKKRTAEFTHFIPISHPVELRAYIRVEPRSIVKAKITHDKKEINGHLCDFSEVAVAVYVRNIDIEQYEPGMIVRFMANIPYVYEEGSISINTSGEITKIYHPVKEDSNAYRLVIHWKTDRTLKSKLLQHISQRQVEIMKELKELSQDTY